jgi:Apoptosis antagonizing transcription factor
MFAASYSGGSNAAAQAALTEVKLFESVLGLRISLQKPLDCCNKFPVFDEPDSAIGVKNDDITEVSDILKSVMGDISALLEIQVENQDSLDDEVKKRALRQRGCNRNEDGWEDILKLQEALRPSWQRTINKWHARLHFGSEHIKSKMKVFNQTVWEQIDAALQDDDRVVEKSRIPWEDSTRIAKESNCLARGKKRTVGEEEDEKEHFNEDSERDRERQRSRPRAARSYDMECYDDRTFYSTLLKVRTMQSIADF